MFSLGQTRNFDGPPQQKLPSEGAPALVLILDRRDMRLRFANAAVRVLAPGALPGRTLAEILPGLERAALMDSLGEVQASGRTEARFTAIDVDSPKGPRKLCLAVEVLPDSAGSLLVFGADVTEASALNQQQALGARELAHRLKNSAAVAQALLQQVAREFNLPVAAVRAFAARLTALPDSHDLCLGSAQEVPLTQLLDHELSPFGLSRFRMSGPPVMLARRAGIGLGMLLHELATNSAKHGALAGEQSWVELSWKVSNGALCEFTWAESCERGLRLDPRRRVGVGQGLIDQVSARYLSARIERIWRPQGLLVQLLWDDAKGMPRPQ